MRSSCTWAAWTVSEAHTLRSSSSWGGGGSSPPQDPVSGSDAGGGCPGSLGGLGSEGSEGSVGSGPGIGSWSGEAGLVEAPAGPFALRLKDSSGGPDADEQAKHERTSAQASVVELTALVLKRDIGDLRRAELRYPCRGGIVTR